MCIISKFDRSYTHRVDALHRVGRTPVGFRNEKATNVITKKFRDYANKGFYQDSTQKRTDASNDVNRVIQFYNRNSGIVPSGGVFT